MLGCLDAGRGWESKGRGAEDWIGRGDEQRLGVAPCAVEGVVTAERRFEEGSKFERVWRTRRARLLDGRL